MVEGYRTAINKVLKAVKGLDIGKDTALPDLLNNFRRDMPIRKSTVLNWDLSLVLTMLAKSPVGPMHLAEVKFATLKTVFLLALSIR